MVKIPKFDVLTLNWFTIITRLSSNIQYGIYFILWWSREVTGMCEVSHIVDGGIYIYFYPLPWARKDLMKNWQGYQRPKFIHNCITYRPCTKFPNITIYKVMTSKHTFLDIIIFNVASLCYFICYFLLLFVDRYFLGISRY